MCLAQEHSLDATGIRTTTLMTQLSELEFDTQDRSVTICFLALLRRTFPSSVKKKTHQANQITRVGFETTTISSTEHISASLLYDQSVQG